MVDLYIAALTIRPTINNRSPVCGQRDSGHYVTTLSFFNSFKLWNIAHAGAVLLIPRYCCNIPQYDCNICKSLYFLHRLSLAFNAGQVVPFWSLLGLLTCVNRMQHWFWLLYEPPLCGACKPLETWNLHDFSVLLEESFPKKTNK